MKNKINCIKIFIKIPISFIYTPAPININYFWNFGSILGIFLIIQIISGLFLSIHYCPNIDLAFKRISHIIKDVNSGWLIRLIHINGASFYFILIYLHIIRNIYYQSYNKLTCVWQIGRLILFLSIITAFLGYILPWGQISFWGAIVITNLLSAIPYIGNIIVEWVWGGFSINNATLNRFFSLHFILPLIILSLVFIHLIVLHLTGSSNPIHSNRDIYKIPFHPYFTLKDSITIIFIIIIFIIINFQNPYILGDPDNFKIANPIITPIHIKPEWYFLFCYSILRTIPNKLGGVIIILIAIFILFLLPLINNKIKNYKFYPINKYIYWIFINTLIILTWLGAQPIEYPFTLLNKIHSIIYFWFFIFSFFISNFTDFILWKKY